jgi:tRNA threonylcarbamoyladenosine biosynthesis protein TsaB
MSQPFSIVLETSTPQASLARVGADGVIERRDFRSDRNHNAMLFGPLDELLGGRDCRDIALILVGSGPGSYSGTRVGIAAAQGAAIAAGCPAVAVPSILAVPSAAGGAACLAIGDARRGSYWMAMGRDRDLESDPGLYDAAGLEAAVIAAVAAHIPVISFEDPARFPLPDGLLGRVRLEFPDAGLLWSVWCGATAETRERWSALVPQPLYLRPPHITPGKDPCLVSPAFRRVS